MMPIAAGLLGASSAACVQVEGGAAELSWSLRTFEGGASSCEATGIETVRLCWMAKDARPEVAEDLDCAEGQWKDFSCTDSRGVTAFDIGAEEQLFWVVPLCPGMTPPPAYEVPSPILRSVQAGGVITLNSLLIVTYGIPDECTRDGLSCAACDVPCACELPTGGGT